MRIEEQGEAEVGDEEVNEFEDWFCEEDELGLLDEFEDEVELDGELERWVEEVLWSEIVVILVDCGLLDRNLVYEIE